MFLTLTPVVVPLSRLT